jgi:GMP synthase-like glutamine amidotransferase
MLLIIQNGYFETHIFKYLDEEYEIIKSNTEDVSKLNLDKYSIIIILGGHQSIVHITDYPYLINLVIFIEKCIEINKPVLGICLGCQLIAYTLGCQVKASNKLNIGYDTKILEFEHIFRCHYDYVVPNNNLEILEMFDSMPYLFKYHNLIGIQCHPDIPPENIFKYPVNVSSIDFANKHSDEIDRNNRELIKYLLTELKKK